MESTAYAQDFAQFLKLTDEKNVLLNEIKAEIQGTESLLDIGAGDGLLAIQLAPLVSKYTAIERNPDHVANLMAADLHVIDGEFPCFVKDKYNIVLLSHVISHRSNNWQALLRAAKDLLAPNGKIILFTYQGESDDWNILRKEIGLEIDTSKFQTNYDDMLCYLKKLGRVDVRVVTTTVKSTLADQLIASLAFVASNGIATLKENFLAKTDQLKTILNSRYKKGSTFVFPFQHTMIVVTPTTKTVH